MCLSVIQSHLDFCCCLLQSVAPPGYSRLCSPKNHILCKFIHSKPMQTIFPAYPSLCRSLNIFLSAKTITKMSGIFSVAHIIAKLSRNVCLIDTHALIHRHAYCDCKLWKTLRYYSVFFWVFSYIIDEHSCLKYCFFTKHSQIVCLINAHILIYQHARCDCKLWKVP